MVVLVALGSVLSGSLFTPASAAYTRGASSSWVPNRAVFAVVRDGNRVYIGGAFTSLRNPATGVRVRRPYVAALDANTGAVLPWNPGTDGKVRALSVGGNGTVYLGGEFTSAAGKAAIRLAAIRPDGTAVNGWTASANRTVFGVWAGSSGVYVSGAFGQINGKYRARVARLSLSNGALVKTFNARVGGGRVRTITPSPDGQSLLLGGSFKSLSGYPRAFAGAVALTTGAASSWSPKAVCDTCYVFDLASSDGRVYAAMAGPGGRAVAWSATTGARLWARGGDGDVQAIDVEDGVVYAGGHFGPTFSGVVRHQLVALNAAKGTLLSYTLPFSGKNYPGIWAVLADSTGLRIGGGFTLAGNPAAKYAAFAPVS